MTFELNYINKMYYQLYIINYTRIKFIKIL
jgi:hypothetical protein